MERYLMSEICVLSAARFGYFALNKRNWPQGRGGEYCFAVFRIETIACSTLLLGEYTTSGT